MTTSIDSMWKFIPGRESISSIAIDAYRNASSYGGRGNIFDIIR